MSIAMSRLVLVIPSVAGLLIGWSSAADQASGASRDTRDYGRPTVFVRGQGEQRMLRGTRPYRWLPVRVQRPSIREVSSGRCPRP